MSKRTVTLKLTTQKDLVVRESNARTFGELKGELYDIKFDGMRVVERSTKNTLQMDDAVLPATDFVLFLVPEKVKSGGRMKQIDVENASYNELRSQISMLNRVKNAGIDIAGSKESLRNGLRQYLNGTETPKELKTQVVPESETETKSPIEIIEDCRADINQAIDKIIEACNATPKDTTDYVFKTSISDLENEVSMIKSSLNL
jgi:hypothetical protein